MTRTWQRMLGILLIIWRTKPTTQWVGVRDQVSRGITQKNLFLSTKTHSMDSKSTFIIKKTRSIPRKWKRRWLKKTMWRRFSASIREATEKLEELMKKWILSQLLADSLKCSLTREFRKCWNPICGAREPKVSRTSWDILLKCSQLNSWINWKTKKNSQCL